MRRDVRTSPATDPVVPRCPSINLDPPIVPQGGELPAPVFGEDLLAHPAPCQILAACAKGRLPFGILGQDGLVVAANEELKGIFPEKFRNARVTLSELMPDPLPEAKAGCGFLLGVAERENRKYLIFVTPEVEVPKGKVRAFFALDTENLYSKEYLSALDKLNVLQRIIDLSVEGMQVVNGQGIITMVNRSFEEIHGIPREQAVGRHVTEVIENTRMHIVAQTGVAEVDDLQRIQGHDYVVSRIPIYQGGKCVGAIGKIVFQGFQEINRLNRKVEELKTQLETLRKAKGVAHPDTRFTFDDIVAHSDAGRTAKERAMRSAVSNSTVLLMGESGVGKEVFAHAIHHLSQRSRRPFVRVNCSAILESLFESELFGYADGAFTGAKKGGKQGKFELAHTGTIFLDEIGDMPLPMQAKLLRVLQEREIDRVGGEGVFHVDVRIIAATNQDLWGLVGQGRFRKDLYYRLNVIPIVIPPLRERAKDLPDLVKLFWTDLQRTHGVYYKHLSEGAKRLLEGHGWPGNIRELRNVLERAMNIVLEDSISEEQMRMLLVGVGASVDVCGNDQECTLDKVVALAEKQAISFALARANNMRAQAAKMLGISRPLLYRKMHEYGMM